MVQFSGTPANQGFFAPQRFEADVYDCEVVGEIPKDLDGAFIRIGSGWQYPPLHLDDSPFNEDGYVSSFRFKNGKVDYKGRWIHTERFRNNQQAGRQLYGYYRNPFTDDPSIRDVEHPNRRTLANTTPVAFAGKLMALKEDGHPYLIDPNTLATLGQWDFHGGISGQTFTAHPKIDPVSGEMVAFGYEATGLATDDLWVYHIDPSGHVAREQRIKVPYVSMVHDVALTQEHLIIPVFPYVTSLERLKTGKIHWAWDYDKPIYYGVLPRKGDGRDIRWFKGPQRGVVHTLNARTEGSKVILDAPIFDGNPFPFFPFVDGSRWDPMKGRAYFRRVTFDLASKDDGYTEEILIKDTPIVDLVRVDDRRLSLPYRYAFTSYNDPKRPFDEARAGKMNSRISNCYGRFDLQTGRLDSYFAGATCSLQEVTFIPRSPDVPEGSGYLIGVANNLAEMRSELIVADADNLAAGDLARVILPFRSNVQVHGRWFSAQNLPFV